MHASLGLKAWPRAQKESRYKSILEHKNGMFQVGAYSLWQFKNIVDSDRSQMLAVGMHEKNSKDRIISVIVGQKKVIAQDTKAFCEVSL